MTDGRPTKNQGHPLTFRHRSCLELAKSIRLRTVALCCISTSIFRFLNEEAIRIAMDTVRGFLDENGG